MVAATFASRLKAANAHSLCVFGDSITAGMSASQPHRRWANLLAKAAGGLNLRNKGIGGTILQGSPAAGGLPRPDNGHSRYREALLGQDRADAIAILYGCNDARYVGAPDTLNLDGFVRDYADILDHLLVAGFDPAQLCLGSLPHLPDVGFSVGSMGFTGQHRAVFDAHIAAVRALAQAYKTFYAPVNECMQACGGDALISADHVHPNDQGHAVIARTFARAILI